ncbi:MAG TPA: type IV pilus secretin PilQ [Terriglobales bacterium]|nr:type IV pilus secretin PilQ [Terriglobales bacterium]
MKKRILPALIASLSILALVAHAESPGPAVTISRIQVQPGTLAAKLILETDGPLAAPKAYYLADSPRTLVLDIDRAKTSQAPLIPSSEAQFIRDIQVQKAGAQDLRFLVRLNERVPIRIGRESGRTVVEFSKILRSSGGYLIDAETQSRLDRRPKGEIFLDKVDFTQAADRVSFRAELSDQAVAQVFALENPSRLVVDLYDTVLTAKTNVWSVDQPQVAVEKARVGQFQQSNPRAITRLVFDLKEPGVYSLDSDKSGLTVSFYKTIPAAEVKAAPAPAASAPATDTPKAAPAARQEEPKANPVPIKFDPPAAAEAKAEPKPVAKPVVTQAPPTPPPQAAAPAQEKKTSAEPDKFKPKTIAAEDEKYSGEVLSLKFKDADLRDVVLYLAEFASLNVVFDSDVRGTVTCNLQDVPWDQALDIVLKQNKMGKSIEGNVLRIAPIGILTREQEDERKMKESKELAGPVQTKTYPLSYSKAKDVAALIKSKVSTRGELLIDDRTNTLLITDVKDKLDLIEKLLSVVDTPTPQVSIEARVVEASSTFVRNLGIQWGFKINADSTYGTSTSLQFPNQIDVNGALIPQGTTTKGIGGPLGGYAINLPAPSFNTALGMSFANVLDTFRLDVALTALESQGEGKIISHPQVTTQNNMEADIIQGRQIPVQTVANFTVTTRYVNAALELKATPQITAEGTIIMKVDIQNNAADFANLVNGIPPITTQSVTTTIMVPDGGTTVIGGIYRTEDSVTREKTPFLSQVPILGSLFRNFARTKTSRELLIFITPRIIK